MGTLREIKFRVWDKSTNRMDHPTTLFLSGGKWHNSVELSWASGVHATGVIFMQFTSLKDKNGKDIYEGDILKGEPRSPFTRKPPIEHDVVVWKDFGWKRKSYNGDIEVYPDLYVRSCEVIGNIYENPELLTEQKPHAP